MAFCQVEETAVYDTFAERPPGLRDCNDLDFGFWWNTPDLSLDNHVGEIFNPHEEIETAYTRELTSSAFFDADIESVPENEFESTQFAPRIIPDDTEYDDLAALRTLTATHADAVCNATNSLCNQCAVGSPTSNAREDHALGNGHKSYVCTEPGCKKTFSRRDTFQRHKTSHKPVDDQHKCEACGKAFPRKDHMTLHMRNCQKTPVRSARTPLRQPSLAMLSSGVSKPIRPRPLPTVAVRQPEEATCRGESSPKDITTKPGQKAQVKNLVKSMRAILRDTPGSTQLLYKLEAQAGDLGQQKTETLVKEFAEWAVRKTAPDSEVS